MHLPGQYENIRMHPARTHAHRYTHCGDADLKEGEYESVLAARMYIRRRIHTYIHAYIHIYAHIYDVYVFGLV